MLRIKFIRSHKEYLSAYDVFYGCEENLMKFDPDDAISYLYLKLWNFNRKTCISNWKCDISTTWAFTRLELSVLEAQYEITGVSL